eukprot:2527744-Rhodomonas_salina.1
MSCLLPGKSKRRRTLEWGSGLQQEDGLGGRITRGPLDSDRDTDSERAALRAISPWHAAALR